MDALMSEMLMKERERLEVITERLNAWPGLCHIRCYQGKETFKRAMRISTDRQTDRQLVKW